AHPGKAIDIWQQPITQMSCIQKRLIDCGCGRLENVRLTLDVSAMNPVNRIEDRELMPASIQLLIFRVLLSAGIVHKESARILCPIGKAGQSYVDAPSNLRVKGIPTGSGVA